jgi:hypothetical protein
MSALLSLPSHTRMTADRKGDGSIIAMPPDTERAKQVSQATMRRCGEHTEWRPGKEDQLTYYFDRRMDTPQSAKVAT